MMQFPVHRNLHSQDEQIDMNLAMVLVFFPQAKSYEDLKIPKEKVPTVTIQKKKKTMKFSFRYSGLQFRQVNEIGGLQREFGEEQALVAQGVCFPSGETYT